MMMLWRIICCSFTDMMLWIWCWIRWWIWCWTSQGSFTTALDRHKPVHGNRLVMIQVWIHSTPANTGGSLWTKHCQAHTQRPFGKVLRQYRQAFQCAHCANKLLTPVCKGDGGAKFATTNEVYLKLVGEVPGASDVLPKSTSSSWEKYRVRAMCYPRPLVRAGKAMVSVVLGTLTTLNDIIY